LPCHTGPANGELARLPPCLSAQESHAGAATGTLELLRAAPRHGRQVAARGWRRGIRGERGSRRGAVDSLEAVLRLPVAAQPLRAHATPPAVCASAAAAPHQVAAKAPLFHAAGLPARHAEPGSGHNLLGGRQRAAAASGGLPGAGPQRCGRRDARRPHIGAAASVARFNRLGLRCLNLLAAGSRAACAGGAVPSRGGVVARPRLVGAQEADGRRRHHRPERRDAGRACLARRAAPGMGGAADAVRRTSADADPVGAGGQDRGAGGAGRRAGELHAAAPRPRRRGETEAEVPVPPFPAPLWRGPARLL